MAVAGADRLSATLSIPASLTGVLVLGLGTSLPELLVSGLAAARGAPGLAIGNVVGSNIQNILLVLGAVSLLRPLSGLSGNLRLDAAALSLLTGVAAVVLADGALSSWEALPLAGTACTWLGLTLAVAKRNPGPPPDDQADGLPLPAVAAQSVLGLGMTLIGAELVVRAALATAGSLGLASSLLGLTVVALGTSLPEFATTAAAAVRGRSGMAVGNVVGSNIYNLGLVLPVTAFGPPPAESSPTWGPHLAVMALATLALLPTLVFTRRLGRAQGVLLLLGLIGWLWIVPP